MLWQSADGIEHLVAAVDRSLSFPSAEFVRRALRKAAERHLPHAPLVIDATHVQAADFTAAKVRQQAQRLHSRLRKTNVFTHISFPDHVFRKIKTMSIVA